MTQLRLATPEDLPAIRELIPLSVRGLSQEQYSEAQIESALRFVFGPDSQLIADGTYLVVSEGTRLVACGGWSRRRTLYGGDQAKRGDDPLLDPAHEAARIRAFFVHPDWARRGLGTRILEACREEARASGFRAMELMATLPGVPLYRRCGFEAVEPVVATLPDGVQLPLVRMTCSLVARPTLEA